MNVLTLDIGIESDMNDQTLLLFIDNIEFRRMILDNSSAAVFSELEKSLEGAGDYLIFTCSCGIADCGGWEKVKINHTEKIVSWTFNYTNKQHNFAFNKAHYAEEIDKMKKRIEKDKIILYPQNVIDPE